MTALRSISKLLRGETDLERHRRRMRYYTWLVDVLRIDGSVTLRILGPVLTVTLFATFVATMVQVYGHNWKLTNNVVPLLSVVVGLILVFRNGTSYDRYYEGRKDFGMVMSNVRNLARLLWVNANLPHASDDSKTKQPAAFMKIRGKTYQPSKSVRNPVITAASLRIEKERALKLMVAFVVAVKHHLRGEEGVDHPDYIGLLPADFSRFDNRGFNKSGRHGNRDYSGLSSTTSAMNIPNNGGSSSHAQGLSTSAGDMDATLVPGSVPRSPHKITFFGNKGAAPDPERNPLLGGEQTTVVFRPYDTRKALPMPLIIAHEMTRLIHKFRRSGVLDTIGPAGVNTMNTLIQNMIDQVTAMERVANTPIPLSYSIHLKQCVTLYLFSLPFTLIGDLGWRMIPIVTLVAYTLMGIEGIANEIEMPFGRDPSDLPLDRYCAELRDEIEYVMENLAEGDDDLDSDDEH
ncbi:bestrophin protein [Rhizoctonia solani 123E]|uniref:Bestrophin protein n=2 Tax=Rhizoctonia solani TaxID=456999 RepID=A0A074S8L3_9AGAM|nr:bestrophin protein [Rhizoctonia solani 123E]